jgi:acyl-coenzyme A synthetase/AMP-(fatty) acid ligase
MLRPSTVPIALAAPAAIAGLAYLNAKTGLSYDIRLLCCAMYALRTANNLEKNKRCNLFYILEQHANDKKVANSTFILFQGRQWTFKQVYETTLKYGTWLKATFNVKPGDIVCIDFMNSEKFMFMWFGLWSIGAKPAFINYNLTGKALAHCIRVSTSKLVLVDTNVAANVTDDVRAELPGIELVIFTPKLEADAMTITAVRQPDSDRVVEKLQELALLIYTSGTTGLPKPAIISWQKSIVGAQYTSYWCGITRSDVFYTVSAMALHIG